MSLIKQEYQKQTDGFCNECNIISGQELWEKAKNEQYKEKYSSTVTEIRSSGIAWKAAIPAILCFLLVGTTTLAATGHLGDLFRNVFKDAKTAEIIEDGYYYEMNEVQEYGIFQTSIVGVTGDTASPKIVLDITVSDKELVKKCNKIYVEAYCLGTEIYENELEHYGTVEAYGERDTEIPNLYHVSLPGGWIATGQEVVLDIIKIRLGSQQTKWETFDVSMKYQLFAPQDSFYPTQQVYMEFKEFEFEGREYYLIWGLVGYYDTELIFRFGYDELKAVEKGVPYDAPPEDVRHWYDFIKNVVLVVDGVEYTVKPDDMGYPWYECDDDGQYYHAHPYFTGIEYDKVSRIEVKCGETCYRLK